MSDEYSRVLAQLEMLRRSGDRGMWAALRRLAIIAPCCKDRRPLLEVMDTDPPVVLVGQVTYGEVNPDDPERKPWSAAQRGGQGIVWLAAFERMAERNAKQYVWCRHRRWPVPAADVVQLRGRHVLPGLDTQRRKLT